MQSSNRSSAERRPREDFTRPLRGEIGFDMLASLPEDEHGIQFVIVGSRGVDDGRNSRVVTLWGRSPLTQGDKHHYFGI